MKRSFIFKGTVAPICGGLSVIEQPDFGDVLLGIFTFYRLSVNFYLYPNVSFRNGFS